MAKVTVCFFLEDNAQESLIPPLLQRVAVDEGRDLACFEFQVLASRGGASLESLKLFVEDRKRAGMVGADAVVVGLDGNCKGFAARRDEIREMTADLDCPAVITAVPDPHVERWFMLDIGAMRSASGVQVAGDIPAYKCEKGRYKRLLRDAFMSTEVRPPLGGVEYGPAIAERIDLYHAGRADPALAEFIGQVRDWIRQLPACDGNC